MEVHFLFIFAIPLYVLKIPLYALQHFTFCNPTLHFAALYVLWSNMFSLESVFTIYQKRFRNVCEYSFIISYSKKYLKSKLEMVL